MKTKVDGLLIKDEFGVQRRVTSRCVNGDFKRKYIWGLIRQGILQPTPGVVTLLGELLCENEALRRDLKATEEELKYAEECLTDAANAVANYYGFELGVH